MSIAAATTTPVAIGVFDLPQQAGSGDKSCVADELTR
jgi:hypothetical protein